MIDAGLLFCYFVAIPFPPLVLKTLFAVWLAALGGAVGSFLNVVVYRVPAGKSLVWPGSHCPICGHPIRWHDNVPVLGWLVLGGRCRDCRARISARYPGIEAAGAALFLTLGLVEVLGWGEGLPVRPVAVVGGTIRPTLAAAELAGLLAYHLSLFSTLLAAVLIEYDDSARAQSPRPHRQQETVRFRGAAVRVLGPALAIGVLCPLGWPHLHPVPAGPALNGWTGGLADDVAGLAAGGLLGLIAWPCVARPRRAGLLGCLACTGLFLGWQAIVAVAAVALGVQALVTVLARLAPGLRRIPPTAWVAAGALAWVLAWRPLLTAWPWLAWSG